MSASEATYDDIIERELFLIAVAEGTPEVNAAIEVGWTPFKMRRVLADPDFAELVGFAKQQADGEIQKVLYQQAKKGMGWAVTLWLFNRDPDNWKDTKRIEVHSTTKIEIGIVGGIKEAAMQLISQAGPAALQPGGPLDIVDAEIIED